MHQHLRNRLLRQWAMFVARRPKTTLAIALILAAASVAIAAGLLQFQSNRNDLIDAEIPWNKRFIRWQSTFPGSQDLVIAVDPFGDDADAVGEAADLRHASARRLIDRMGDRLAAESWVAHHIGGFDEAAFSPKAMRLLPLDELRSRVAEISQAAPLVQSRQLSDLLANILAETERRAMAALAQGAPGAQVSPNSQNAQGTASGTGVDELESVEAGRGDIGTTDPAAVAADQLAVIERIVAGIHAALVSTPEGDAAEASAYDHRITTMFGESPATVRDPSQNITPHDHTKQDHTPQASSPQDSDSSPKTAVGRSYLVSDNGRMYFILVTPQSDTSRLSALQPTIDAVREIIRQTPADVAGVEAGLTGIEVVEADETAVATFDSTIASLSATLLISIMLMGAFHSVRSPLLAVGALLVGIAWSFGFLTLAIGHLQVLSVVFAVILLGLGIDFGIHLTTGFELLRHRYPDTPDGFGAALSETFQRTGPGVMTGAVTTAAAFMTTVFTDFTGVAEMGLIASAGIMLCLLAMFTVFPALLRLFKPPHRHIAPIEKRHVTFFNERWIMPISRRPLITLAVVVAVTGAAGWLTAKSMQFDYNLMNLQPPNTPSMKWADRVTGKGGQSIWYAVSVADDLATARERAAAFRALDQVQPEIRGVGMLTPADEAAKLAAIDVARVALASAWPSMTSGADSETAAQLDPQGIVDQLLAIQSRLNRTLALPLAEAFTRPLISLRDAVSATLDAAAALPVTQRDERLSSLDAAFGRFRADRVQTIRDALDPAPLTFDDVPAALMRSYRAPDGRVSLEIYPKLPEGVESPLDPAFLPGFIDALRTVDPEVTGVMVQVFESGAMIRDAYVQAAMWAMLIVFLLVLFDFQNVIDALICLAPVVVGFIACFGLMSLFDMHINMANIIVLPLMFGIGIDAGVHIMHRWHDNPAERPLGLTHGTGKGVTLTSLTTIIGFACMAMASHRGIRSLGLTLVIGVALILVASWVLVPALLELRQRRVERNTPPAGSTSRGDHP